MPETTSRTDAICTAILSELKRRRLVIDENASLRSISVTVYLNIQDAPGDVVQSTSVEEHTQRRRRREQ